MRQVFARVAAPAPRPWADEYRRPISSRKQCASFRPVHGPSRTALATPRDGGMMSPEDKKWLKPNGENPRERGSNPFIGSINPPSTAGLDRFAENPVNGVQRHHLAQQIRA